MGNQPASVTIHNYKVWGVLMDFRKKVYNNIEFQKHMPSERHGSLFLWPQWSVKNCTYDHLWIQQTNYTQGPRSSFLFIHVHNAFWLFGWRGRLYHKHSLTNDTLNTMGDIYKQSHGGFLFLSFLPQPWLNHYHNVNKRKNVYWAKRKT